MSVPRGSRQRNESTSSNGSWQLVTNTGSFKTTDSYMSAANREKRSVSLSDGVLVFEDDPMFDILEQ